MAKKQIVLENIRLGKLVHGGQCLAESENGKKLFVWGGLPGELVDVRVTKKKSSFMEAIVTEVHESSAERIEPEEPLSYLSTSPWQIMTFEAENNAKQAILEEAFAREGIKNLNWHDLYSNEQQYCYRNKMEMGFWGDDDGLHLAHYVRGTHGKQKVQGSALAMDCINQAAQAVRDELQKLDVWAGDLKTVLLRANRQNEVVGALFIKKELDLSKFELPKVLKGLDIYYSNPQSPASVPTRKLYSLGDIKLTDSINGKNITYDVLSFFQVNLPVFKQSLEQIADAVETSDENQKVVDMYSGVGTIGLATGADVLVESEDANIKMASENVSSAETEVIHATSETALTHIQAGDVLIVDPPRAGLHKVVIDRIMEVKPNKIMYLSCNPSTQARDVKLLSAAYSISSAQGYNFFPRTPHIECLIILELK